MPTGIDFSFSRVPPSVATAAGHAFAVSYLTDLDSSIGHAVKAWRTSEIAAYRAAGLGVVAVWQGGEADRTTAWRGGFDRGRRDALRAATQATALGRPDGRPVYFAIDADASTSDLALISRYFDGVASVFDVANIGVYGGRRTVEWAMGSGRVSWFWQTGAWSGSVVPGIHLYQRVPSTRLGSYAIDIDDAMQPDYGSWWGGSPMPDLWMPGATRLDSGDRAGMDGGPAKAIGHITWDRNATRAKPQVLVPWGNLVDWFGRNPEGIKAAPHILWNPWTGAFVQFVPANCRSKSLADGAGGTRTNRAGSVVIQVEAYFFPWCTGPDGRVYERLIDTPCKGWPELNAWIRDLGVPDVWPMGRPTSFAANRSESTWETRGGWYGHSQVPENDHQDPGSWPEFTTMEDDVTPEDIDKVAAAVWNHYEADPQGGDPLRMGAVMAYQDTVEINTRNEIGGKVDAVGAKVGAPVPVTVDAKAVATALAADTAFIGAIAKATADVVAKRLEA